MICSPGLTSTQHRKLNRVHIHKQEWALVKILKNSLKVFYEATVILSGKNYQTLSVSKFVQNALFNYFDQIVDKFGKVTIATQSTSSQQKIEQVKGEIAKNFGPIHENIFQGKSYSKRTKGYSSEFQNFGDHFVAVAYVLLERYNRSHRI